MTPTNLPPGPFTEAIAEIRRLHSEFNAWKEPGAEFPDLLQIRKDLHALLYRHALELCDASEEAEARERTGGWIAVGEQMPSGDDEVLVASADGIAIGWLTESWWSVNGRLREVTAWQPLPAPPKEPTC